MAEETPKIEPEFAIKQLYVKDLSLEVPHAPEIYSELSENPELNMDLDIKTKTLPEEQHEVTLTVILTAKLKERIVFLIEVQQSGIFLIKNFPSDDVRRMYGIFCPNILYPYARQVITKALIEANFPHIYLSPVNFEALFEEHNRNEEKQSGETDDRVH